MIAGLLVATLVAAVASPQTELDASAGADYSIEQTTLE